jgi:putative oxidoreductase
MLDRIPSSWLRTLPNPWAAPLAVVLRLVGGVAMIGFGIGKFTSHASEVVDFRHYGVPFPEVAVPLAGTIETVGGILVLVGLLTRPAAALVALNLLGALLTAGRVDGGRFHLVVGPTFMVMMVAIAILGPGAPSVDARVLAGRGPTAPRRARGPRPPGAS